MEENIHTYMPGFTHLQKAQPITLAHHMGAYFEMFKRDMRPPCRHLQENELLSAWVPVRWLGQRIRLDRDYTAELLGFDGPTLKQHGFRIRQRLSD